MKNHDFCLLLPRRPGEGKSDFFKNSFAREMAGNRAFFCARATETAPGPCYSLYGMTPYTAHAAFARLPHMDRKYSPYPGRSAKPVCKSHGGEAVARRRLMRCPSGTHPALYLLCITTSRLESEVLTWHRRQSGAPTGCGA